MKKSLQNWTRDLEMQNAILRRVCVCCPLVPLSPRQQETKMLKKKHGTYRDGKIRRFDGALMKPRNLKRKEWGIRMSRMVLGPTLIPKPPPRRRHEHIWPRTSLSVISWKESGAHTRIIKEQLVAMAGTQRGRWLRAGRTGPSCGAHLYGIVHWDMDKRRGEWARKQNGRDTPGSVGFLEFAVVFSDFWSSCREAFDVLELPRILSGDLGRSFLTRRCSRAGLYSPHETLKVRVVKWSINFHTFHFIYF